MSQQESMKSDYTVTFTMIEVPFLTHKSGNRVLRARSVEDVAFGVLRVKTMGPQALKVDRVYQNQVSIFHNAAWRQEIANMAFCHIADPIVDLISHLGGVCTEISYLQLIPKEIEHTFAQPYGICNPKSVGDTIIVGIRRSNHLK